MTNIYNLFKFLEKKKNREIPFIIKLIYNPEEITQEDLDIYGDLDLCYSKKIKELPDGLKVDGFLDARHSGLLSLPDNLEVTIDLDLFGSDIEKLPSGLKVHRDLDIRATNIRHLPNDLEVGGNIRKDF